jgi:hypothetical protein
MNISLPGRNLGIFSIFSEICMSLQNPTKDFNTCTTRTLFLLSRTSHQTDPQTRDAISLAVSQDIDSERNYIMNRNCESTEKSQCAIQRFTKMISPGKETTTYPNLLFISRFVTMAFHHKNSISPLLIVMREVPTLAIRVSLRRTPKNDHDNENVGPIQKNTTTTTKQ